MFGNPTCGENKVRHFGVQCAPFLLVLLINSSCAWWGAETTIETRAESRMTSSILNVIQSELQLSGHSIHSINDRKDLIVTEWMGPHLNQRRRDIPNNSYRYKLRFQSLNQYQQVLISVRYQELRRGNRTTTVAWRERSDPNPGRSGWYTIWNVPGLTPNFERKYLGESIANLGDSNISSEKQYGFKSALWDDRQPDWIIDPIEDLLNRVIRRMGIESEFSWMLVKQPELSGPRYRGQLPRKKN